VIFGLLANAVADVAGAVVAMASGQRYDASRECDLQDQSHGQKSLEGFFTFLTAGRTMDPSSTMTVSAMRISFESRTSPIIFDDLLKPEAR
jgi:hypothetical protein